MTTPFLMRNCLLILVATSLSSSVPTSHVKNPPAVHADRTWSASARLSNTLECFNPLNNTAAYSISICADIPDDNHPDRVHMDQEPGHVFLVLEKEELTGETKKMTSLVFGFYPRRPASSLIFKNVRCEIRDNSKREYNASIRKQITAAEFQGVLRQAEELAKKKYNLNRYNCYDYAIGVFNSIPGIEKLPVTRVKFPLIFGRGGSPCALYRDLEKLRAGGSSWAPFISFGKFIAPSSFNRGQR